jgi:hypothetical protein
MTESSSSAPIPRDEVEREFVEKLRAAAYIFEKEEHGRFQGSILACRAVARFIYQRNGGAELAGPFLQIAAAFQDLEIGGKPRLFSKKTVPEKERERSPERKHIHMLAAAALEVRVTLGDERSAAAEEIAIHVNRWPGMSAQTATGQTVIAWRNQQHSLSGKRRKPFDTLTGKMLEEPDPRKTVTNLLINGPPGMWKS